LSNVSFLSLENIFLKKLIFKIYLLISKLNHLEQQYVYNK
jgi:hypothetical protein